MPHILLRPHLLTCKNRMVFRRKLRARGHRELLLVGIAAIIMISIFCAFRIAFNAMKYDPLFLQMVPVKIIELTFYYFLILLFVSNTVAAMGNIYSADNMNLLLLAPVSSFRLYMAKYFETAVETGLMFYVFTIPAALAFVTSLGLPFHFLLTAFAISIPFLLIPVGAGVFLATVATRVIAIIWWRGTFFLGALVVATVYALVQFSSRMDAAREQRGGAALAELIDLFENPNPLWSPARWVSETLNPYFLQNTASAVSSNVFLLVATAAASFALGFLAFDLACLSVRSSSSSNRRTTISAGKVRQSGDLVRSAVSALYWPMPLGQQVRAVIVKDLCSIVRDRTLSLQLLFYLAVGTIYVTIFNFMQGAFVLAPIALQIWVATLAAIHFLFTGFITTTVMTRLVYPSMSLEGRAIWILQVTPIQVETLVKAKLICWLPFTITVTVMLALAGAQAISLDIATTICLGLCAASLALGYTGLAVGLGSIFAIFDWESPNQLNIGTGALVLLLSGLSFVFCLAAPATVLIFLAAVPRLRAQLGLPLGFFAMSGALFVIMFGNLVLARTICLQGARTLLRRKGEIV